ncbi:MAG: hypothetical protein R3F40_09590 [Candidatus Competibacteraceae bacterium]
MKVIPSVFSRRFKVLPMHRKEQCRLIHGRASRDDQALQDPT